MKTKQNLIDRTACRLRDFTCRINALWIRIKYAAALWLDRKFCVYSKTRATVLLALCCAGLSFLQALHIARSLKAGDSKVIKVHRISKVRNIHPPKGNRIVIPYAIPKELMTVRKHLDSLTSDPAARGVYDSLISSRPGLLDSLSRAEYYYREMK